MLRSIFDHFPARFLLLADPAYNPIPIRFPKCIFSLNCSGISFCKSHASWGSFPAFSHQKGNKTGAVAFSLSPSLRLPLLSQLWLPAIQEERARSKMGSWNSTGMEVLYQALGWIAFASWSISFYPQVILNFRRKRLGFLWPSPNLSEDRIFYWGFIPFGWRLWAEVLCVLYLDVWVYSYPSSFEFWDGKSQLCGKKGGQRV